ncbi:MAG: alpha/beta hydrolase family protein [Blastocatellia bacterium]
MTGRTRRDFLTMAVSAVTPRAFSFFAQTSIDLTSIHTRAEWRMAREKILANMQLVMGELPKQKRPPVKIVRVHGEEAQAFYRLKIKYLSEDDDYVPAYLLIPHKRARRAPALLCLHQTTRIGKDEPAGLGGNPNLHYAAELAERGYVTLAPDYPYLGENTVDPYKRGYDSCTMKGVWNHIRAVDVLQSLDYVNPQRIGSIGHSLGGHNTLFVAAFDQRIKAMVTSCGFNSFRKYYGGDLSGWSGVRYMPLIAEKYGKDSSRVPFDFSDILVALAPRPLFINAPLRDSNFEVSGVKDCVAEAAPIYDKIFKAKDSLLAVYPDGGHDFQPEIREQAWRFLDRWLKS